MKKSELRSLIRECVQEVLTEAFLMHKFRDFVEKFIPKPHQDAFVNAFGPFFNKTAENPKLQAVYIQKVIDAAIGKPLESRDRDVLKSYDLDLDDRQTRQLLNRYHAFLAKFLKFTQETP